MATAVQHHEDHAAGSDHAPELCQGPLTVRHVVEHVHCQPDVDRAHCKGKRSGVALHDGLRSACTFGRPGALQHAGGEVHADGNSPVTAAVECRQVATVAAADVEDAFVPLEPGKDEP